MSIKNSNISTLNFEELTRYALSLPIDNRVYLAQILWESISTTKQDNESELFNILVKRDKEISDKKESCRSHKEVMNSAYEAIKCIT